MWRWKSRRPAVTDRNISEWEVSGWSGGHASAGKPVTRVAAVMAATLVTISDDLVVGRGGAAP